MYGAILAHEADEVCDLIWESWGKDISAPLPSAAVVSKGMQGFSCAFNEHLLSHFTDLWSHVHSGALLCHLLVRQFDRKTEIPTSSKFLLISGSL